MSTGLTFGSISALYGLTNHIIDQRQYTILLTTVIGSAVVPTLIANAFFANQRHQLAQLGLQGTLGYWYGPLPTWAYQAFLVFSRDLCLLVFVRALVVTALTALSLASLSRTSKQWPSFAIALMHSPYLM